MQNTLLYRFEDVFIYDAMCNVNIEIYVSRNMTMGRRNLPQHIKVKTFLLWKRDNTTRHRASSLLHKSQDGPSTRQSIHSNTVM